MKRDGRGKVEKRKGAGCTKELDLLPGQQAADVYSVGQLLRVQVGASVPELKSVVTKLWMVMLS